MLNKDITTDRNKYKKLKYVSMISIYDVNFKKVELSIIAMDIYSSFNENLKEINEFKKIINEIILKINKFVDYYNTVDDIKSINESKYKNYIIDILKELIEFNNKYRESMKKFYAFYHINRIIIETYSKNKCSKQEFEKITSNQNNLLYNNIEILKLLLEIKEKSLCIRKYIYDIVEILEKYFDVEQKVLEEIIGVDLSVYYIKKSKKIEINNNFNKVKYVKEQNKVINKIIKLDKNTINDTNNKFKNLIKNEDNKVLIKNLIENKRYNQYLIYKKETYRTENQKENFEEYLKNIVKYYYIVSEQKEIKSLEDFLIKNDIKTLYKYILKFVKDNFSLEEKIKDKFIKMIYKEYSFFRIEKYQEFKKQYNNKSLLELLSIYYRINNIDYKTSKVNKEKEDRYIKENIKEVNNNLSNNIKEKNTNIYNIYNIKEEYFKDILKVIKMFGKEYTEVVLESISNNVIYYFKNAKIINGHFNLYKNIIFCSELEKYVIIHELGHYIQDNITSNVNPNPIKKNKILLEIYSQILELAYIDNFNIKYNKSLEYNIKEDIEEKYKYNIYNYRIMQKLLNIFTSIKRVNVEEKILKYIKDVIKDNQELIDENNIYNILEENIHKLISTFSKEEKNLVRELDKNEMFGDIKYICTFFLDVTIYKKIKKEYETINIKNNNYKSEKYIYKYLESIKQLKEKSIPELLKILEVDPKEKYNELSNNYLEIIYEILNNIC